MAEMSFPEAIITLLGRTSDALVKLVDRRWGIVRAYIEDLRDNIRYEDSNVDAIMFFVDIPGTGVIAAQPPTVRVHPEFLFGMRKLYGFAQDPATNPENIAAVTFQIRELGRGIDVFTTSQNLALLVAGGSSDWPFEWDTPWTFRDGAEIQVTFAVDPNLWTPGEAKRVGISILGDKVRYKILP